MLTAALKKEGTSEMAETVQYEIELTGSTPEPLMAYLKALGVLRLVGEQTDPSARGYWKNEVFQLRSSLEKDALKSFFLEEYKPTPILAPWAGGSGFFREDNKEAVESLCSSDSPRCKGFADAIDQVRRIIENEKIGEKPKGDDKAHLIRRYRRELPDAVIKWMDAALVLQHGGLAFAPLLGTGGNDGRLDFTQNFMQRIVTLGLHKSKPVTESEPWLAQAFFSSVAKLNSASVGQFAPGRAGGPNATQGMEGDSIDNPWDFILMLEGSLLFAGAASRRFGTETNHPAFPFTVRPVAAGFDTSASKDASDSRGELWLPLWTRPAQAGELRQLFGEGRAEVAGRAASDGADFARAVKSLGVDRGITGFTRIGFLKRSGKSFLATPLRRFVVSERSEVDLIREIDPWLDRLRRATKKKNAPPRFGSALRNIASAIFDFCKYGGAPLFQKILVALGQAERELANAERFREEESLRPLAGLSAQWIDAAHDNSLEFEIALALAGIHDKEQKIGPIRANLEPINWQKRCREWSEKDRSVVWNAADLSTNLANVLQRRVMDGNRAGCKHLPLASQFTAPLNAIALFLARDLDEERIEQLLWGLMLIDSRQPGSTTSHRLHADDAKRVLPRDYALLKLLFLPRPLIAERGNDKLRWRLARNGETGIVVRPEARILPLLRTGRIGEACRIAAQRLRVSGLPPMPGPLPTGKMRDSEWSDCTSDHQHAQRLAAALLIPISSQSVNHLVHLVCRADDSAAAGIFAISTEGESE